MSAADIIASITKRFGPNENYNYTQEHVFKALCDAKYYEEAKKCVLYIGQGYNGLDLRSFSNDQLDLLLKEGFSLDGPHVLVHLMEGINAERCRIIGKYAPDKLKKIYTDGCRFGGINSVETLQYIVELVGQRNVVASLHSVLHDEGRFGTGCPGIYIHNVEILKFWLLLLKDHPNLQLFILTGSQILLGGPPRGVEYKKPTFKIQENYTISSNLPFEIPYELVFEHINVNCIIMPNTPKYQLELIKRGYKLTKDSHVPIKDLTVFDYMYENDIELDLLYENKTFLQECVLAFKDIIEGRVKSQDTLFPENKHKYVNLYPNLYVATLRMKHNYMEELIQIGVDIDTAHDNVTPLMQAIKNQDLTAIEILLDAGADPDLTSDGKNALWYVNKLSGQVQKQIMDLVFGEQVNTDDLKKENSTLKEKISKLETRLENRDSIIDRLSAEIEALKVANKNLQEHNRTEALKNAVLSSMPK